MKKLFFLLCLSLALTGFAVAQAADSGCSGFEAQFNFLSNGTAGADPTSGLPKVCTAGSAISWITNMALGFAGVIAVVFIIVGGYMYLTSAGNDEAAEKGRKVLTNSIIGLIIIILAATIIRVVVNTLDDGTKTSVTSTITYPSATGTPPASGASSQDLTALSGGVSITATQISASIPKSSENAIKAACGVQAIGSSNTSIRAEINNTSIGISPLSLQGQSYQATIPFNSGTFDQSRDCLVISVCSQEVKFVGKCS